MEDYRTSRKPGVREKVSCTTSGWGGKTTSWIELKTPLFWEDDDAGKAIYKLPVYLWTGVWNFHPGAEKCIRSQKNGNGAVQQCCYDKTGDLITSGPGAGTPDRNDPDHTTSDVAPFKWAIALGCLDDYLERRPPNNGRGCDDNPS